MRYAWCRRLVTAVLLLSLAVSARAVGLFEIHLDAGAGLSSNPDALASFQRAIADWESHITSDVPIRINISADLGTFTDPRIIGSTNIFTPATAIDDINRPYATVRDLMAARSVRPGNAILASLPTSAQVQAHVPYGVFDNTTIGITRANQKALGIVTNSINDTFADGEITFNSAFTFAYKRSDLNPFNVDFQTAATHEIGHVLGFLSDVDDYDTNTAATLTSDNLTTLDLFRFNSSEIPTSAAEFTTATRELRPGQPSVTSDTINSYLMSTGTKNGDGSQASHWQDDGQDSNGNVIHPTIGIMDPTLPNGVFETISAADLRAFELMGYDTVPEPASLSLIGLATIALIARRRPGRATAASPAASAAA